MGNFTQIKSLCPPTSDPQLQISNWPYGLGLEYILIWKDI